MVFKTISWGFESFFSCFLTLMSFLYTILSSFICGTCLLVIGTANPIHAILLLIRVFFIGTVLLFCLQIEYYARLFLIVYVGAIVVLFLFIIMMLELKRVNVSTRLGDLFAFRHLILLCLIFQAFIFINSQFFDLNGFIFKHHDFSALKLDINSYAVVAYSVVLVVFSILIWFSQKNSVRINWINRTTGILIFYGICALVFLCSTFIRLTTCLSWGTTDVTSFEAYLIESNQYINWAQLIYRTDQLRSLGAILYTEYRVSVILASLLLFVSRVGALAVTLFFPKNQFSIEEINSIKRQEPNNQAIRNPKFMGIMK